MPTIDEALDMAMELPLETRLSLINILRKRTTEDIRNKIADDAEKTKLALFAGELIVGSVDDFLSDVNGDSDI